MAENVRESVVCGRCGVAVPYGFTYGASVTGRSAVVSVWNVDTFDIEAHELTCAG